MKQVFTVLLSVLSFSTFAQNWDEVIKAVASDRAGGDNFGICVSISGNRAIVGSPKEDNDVSGGTYLLDAGSAYILELNGGVWTQIAKLVASDRGAGDRFGHSVSLSGDKAIIGAYLEDEDANDALTLSESGSAYIFEFSGGVWIETAKLVASERGIEDRFGIDVDIEGNRAIVGAYQEDEDANEGNPALNAGSTYIFELSGGIWTETTKLVATDRDLGDNFGRKVSVNGNRVVIGAYEEDEDANGSGTLIGAGSAYVFELNGNIWSQTAKLVASDREAGDSFGFDVCILEERIIIGARLEKYTNLSAAGAAYIFELDGGVWSETAKLVATNRSYNAFYGQSVRLSGNKAIVGAFLEDNTGNGAVLMGSTGSVYIYELNLGVWTETDNLIASDASGNDRFGVSVDISDNRIIVGAYFESHDISGGSSMNYSGSIYMFNNCVPPNVTVSGNTLTATAMGATYQWLDCNNGYAVIPSAINQSYTTTVGGSYAVSLTEGGCTDTSACVNIEGLGINDLVTNNIKIYPNPTRETITIDLNELKNVYVSIINSIGEEVFKVANLTQNKLTIPLAEFSNGIYIVKIQSGKSIITKKIVKQ